VKERRNVLGENIEAGLPKIVELDRGDIRPHEERLEVPVDYVLSVYERALARS
jgi:hypothetical protein